MQPVAIGKVQSRTLSRQIRLTMRLLFVLLTVACMQVSARIHGQTITLSVQDSPLENVMRIIESQSPYHFVYSQEAIAVSKPVSLRVKDESIHDLLKRIFAIQPLSYTINENFIILKLSIPATIAPPRLELRGNVVNDEGLPVPGITITIKGTLQSVVTDTQGEFYLGHVEPGAILIVSGAETTKKEVEVRGRSRLTITVTTKISELDQVVMTAYGSTTRKLNLGNITKVTSAEIERQPVSNLLAALQGRVPGMIITQSNGTPGSAFSVQIRGRSSLDLNYSRNDPLFVIDGVPFEAGNIPSNQLVNASNNPDNVNLGGLSPLNTINPTDIESIEVLKDADATAIYGSRGANGVVLITTKKGKAGKLNVSVNVTTGFNRVTRTMDMLNTTQYLAMRREAFKNDGVIPTIINAPDLLAWDTTRYTNYKDKFQGHTANNQNIQISAAGGTGTTQFRIGMGYNRQTNIFSRELSDQVISSHFSLHHTNSDGKLRLVLSGGYAVDNNKLIRDDLTRYKNLPPHVQLTDSSGNLIWSAGGVDYTSVLGTVGNPLALLRRKYSSENKNLFSNFIIAYHSGKFNFNVNFGYNAFDSDELSMIPKSSLPPVANATGSSFFANRHSESWITEPQAEFKTRIGKGSISLLAGGTLQARKVAGEVINATNYTSDLLLSSIGAAGTVTATNSQTQYRYIAFFGRASYQLDEKYLLNASYRVDGSSRFGPDKRFSSFGALGAGWIFSKESFFGFANKFLSFGKLRASYGVTGNDQIDDYRYFDLWTNTNPTYQGVSGLYPTNLFNPDYNWERNRKFEMGLELGFVRDRILFSTSYYRNRSSNQLVQYKLPVQAGFATIVKNLNALVQNTGVECVLTYRSKGKLRYAGSVNFSIPANKLISFPGLAASSYATTYQEGMSLSVSQNHQYLTVNDTTGVYTFVDLNKDGTINSKDYVFNGNTDAKVYGGSQHELTWKNFEFTVFFEFRIQQGINYLARMGTDFPGRFGNQPIIVLNRWQQRGDQAPIQRFSQSSSGLAATANSNFLNSDGIFSDASFARCKNLSLTYQFPSKLVKKMKMESCRLFILSQNLFVLTGYKGADPETQDFFVLPPLKTIVAGIKVNF
jgi:TonB-linked SusC/RagA family outer membrane protein